MPPDSAPNTGHPIDARSEAVSTSHVPRGSIEISRGRVGLESWVIVKIPVPAFESQDETQRRAEILERARKLVDRACEQPDDEPAVKFVWLPAPIEPASREALDASLNAVEGVRWTMTMADQPTQKTDKSQS
jgi:hypothetical protein